MKRLNILMAGAMLYQTLSPLGSVLATAHIVVEEGAELLDVSTEENLLEIVVTECDDEEVVEETEKVIEESQVVIENIVFAD